MEKGLFNVSISLGNAAMMTPEDVASALRHIAATLENTDRTNGIVFDLNGNPVGSFGIDA